MSAWSIGSMPSASIQGRSSNPALKFIGAFVKWIPGDVVALYAATIALQQPDPSTASAPVISPLAWIIALIATPIVVLVSGTLSGQNKIPARMLFSVPSFAIWSATVPHSAWENLTFFNDNQPIVYLVLGLVALVLPPIFDRYLGD